MCEFARSKKGRGDMVLMRFILILHPLAQPDFTAK